MAIPMRQLYTALFFTALGLLGCSSQKQFQADPPFTLSDPTVSYWSGGREASGSGMQVRLRWTPAESLTVTPDSVYFRGRIMKAVLEDTETGMVVLAEYKDDIPENPDMVMHADSTREVGNQPPLPLPAMDFPFELAADEAVLSYSRQPDGKRFYVKIGGVKETRGRIYPGRPRQ